MTITFLDLYNTAASQEWSMYDNDATSTADFEKSLVIDLNKAVSEILYSYPFSFRERTHIIFTTSGEKSYQLPNGLIMKDKFGLPTVKINSHQLNMVNNPFPEDNKTGIPELFRIKDSKIVLYPTPDEKFILTIDYITLAIGENTDNEEIFSLKNSTDTIPVPEYLEEIFKNAVISRTMLNSISSESDENYSAYKKQSEIAYRQLIKFSKGVELNKSVKI